MSPTGLIYFNTPSDSLRVPDAYHIIAVILATFVGAKVYFQLCHAVCAQLFHCFIAVAVNIPSLYTKLSLLQLKYRIANTLK